MLLLFASVRLLEGRDLRDVEAGGCAFGSASLEPVTLQEREGGCKVVKRKGRRDYKSVPKEVESACPFDKLWPLVGKLRPVVGLKVVPQLQTVPSA